jgi:hypothetical protein
MADAKELVSPSGHPLIPEPNLIVLKTPRNITLNQRILSSLSNLTHCAIVQLPMDSEILMGKVAQDELRSLHSAIHAIEQLPYIKFNKEELKVLYAALRYLCEKTAPTEESNEVRLMKQVKKFAA